MLHTSILPALEGQPFTQGDLVAHVRSLEWNLRARRRRSDHLPKELFSDPAWDILLFLTLAHLQQRAVTVNETCLETDAPRSTAIRYLSQLEERDLVTRREDVFDRRRKYVALTELGLNKIKQFFATIGGIGVLT